MANDSVTPLQDAVNRAKAAARVDHCLGVLREAYTYASLAGDKDEAAVIERSMASLEPLLKLHQRPDGAG